jgi:hypothetical protein
MPWKPVEYASITWTNKAECQRQIGAIIESQHRKLQATVETLHRLGLVTEVQAATTAPRLVVTIKCDIKPCPLI